MGTSASFTCCCVEGKDAHENKLPAVVELSAERALHCNEDTLNGLFDVTVDVPACNSPAIQSTAPTSPPDSKAPELESSDVLPLLLEPPSFTIVIERTQVESKLGLQMFWSPENGSVVQAVHPGLVAEWNKVHPSHQVSPGCTLLSVNDETDARAIADMLMSQTGTFHILVQARDAIFGCRSSSSSMA
mmetsp:Transcript_57916/g.137864  ORF Transcript_57916/g.137864 Transcript_57916/m.137864 type:complete len:188 (-) Transcript_57916:89-652(-)